LNDQLTGHGPPERFNLLAVKLVMEAALPETVLVKAVRLALVNGKWPNWVKNGLANYVVGYHPLFMFLKCLRRYLRRPNNLAPLALMVGFCGGYWKRAAQVDDRPAINYLRNQQMNALLGRTSLWSNR
jgi:hypothetical protein